MNFKKRSKITSVLMLMIMLGSIVTPLYTSIESLEASTVEQSGVSDVYEIEDTDDETSSDSTVNDETSVDLDEEDIEEYNSSRDGPVLSETGFDVLGHQVMFSVTDDEVIGNVVMPSSSYTLDDVVYQGQLMVDDVESSDYQYKLRDLTVTFENSDIANYGIETVEGDADMSFSKDTEMSVIYTTLYVTEFVEAGLLTEEQADLVIANADDLSPLTNENDELGYAWSVLNSSSYVISDNTFEIDGVTYAMKDDAELTLTSNSDERQYIALSILGSYVPEESNVSSAGFGSSETLNVVAHYEGSTATDDNFGTYEMPVYVVERINGAYGDGQIDDKMVAWCLQYGTGDADSGQQTFTDSSIYNSLSEDQRYTMAIYSEAYSELYPGAVTNGNKPNAHSTVQTVIWSVQYYGADSVSGAWTTAGNNYTITGGRDSAIYAKAQELDAKYKDYDIVFGYSPASGPEPMTLYIPDMGYGSDGQDLYAPLDIIAGPETGELEVSKIRDANGFDLNDNGWENDSNTNYSITLTGPNGYKETKTLGTGWKATFTDLEPGTYTYTENIKGGGYLDYKTGEGSVKVEAGETAKADVTNIAQSDLVITKNVDTEGYDGLEELDLDPTDYSVTITHTDGTEYTEVFDENWEAHFNDLPAGTYTIVENVKDGVDLTQVSGDESIVIDAPEETAEVTNEALYANVEIAKYDSFFDTIVAGGGDREATFAIWDYDSSTGEIIGDTPIEIIETNFFGKAESSDILIPNGGRTVFIQETDAPEGYYMNGEADTDKQLAEGGYIIELTAGDHETIVEQKYVDVAIEGGIVYIQKSVVDSDGIVVEDADLSGFEFDILDAGYTDSEGNVVTDNDSFGNVADGYTNANLEGDAIKQHLTTDTNGAAKSDYLPFNHSINTVNEDPEEVHRNYTITETATNEDEMYYTMCDDMTFNNLQENIVYSYNCENVLRDIRIDINKTEDWKDTPVEGIEFGLYTEAATVDGELVVDEDSLVQTVTTDSNGYAIFDKVPANQTYYLDEIVMYDENGHIVYEDLDIIVIDEDTLLNDATLEDDVYNLTYDIENTTNTTEDFVLGLTKTTASLETTLSGSKFELTYEYNGEVYTEEVDGNFGMNFIKHLETHDVDGEFIHYTLTEIEAPNGYYVSQEPFTFYLTEEDDKKTMNPVGDYDNWSFQTVYDDEGNEVQELKLSDSQLLTELNIVKVSNELDQEVTVDEEGNVNTDIIEEGDLPASRLAGAEFTVKTNLYPSELYQMGLTIDEDTGEIRDMTDEESLAMKRYQVQTGVYYYEDQDGVNENFSLTAVKGDEVVLESNRISLTDGADYTFTLTETDNPDEYKLTVTADGETSLYIVPADFDLTRNNQLAVGVQSGVMSAEFTASDSDIHTIETEGTIYTATEEVEFVDGAVPVEFTVTVNEEGIANIKLPVYDKYGMPMVYEITETKAPAGFSILEEPVVVYFEMDEDGVANLMTPSEEYYTYDRTHTTTILDVYGSSQGLDLESLLNGVETKTYEVEVEDTDTETETETETETDTDETEDVEVETETKYVYDVTNGYEAAVEFVTETVPAPFYISVVNEEATASLVVNKDVNETNSSYDDITEYLDNYAVNGYEVISNQEYETLSNVDVEDLENEETNNAFSLTGEATTVSNKLFYNSPATFYVQDEFVGEFTFTPMNGATVTINNEVIELTQNEANTVTLEYGDVLNVETGYIYTEQEVETSVETEEDNTPVKNEEVASLETDEAIIIEESGLYVISLNEDSEDTLSFTLNDAVVTSADDSTEVYMNLTTGDEIIASSTELVLYNTALPEDLEEDVVSEDTSKVYSPDSTNTRPTIVTESGNITGGNTEWRLWNQEEGTSAYDQTLVATADGRVHFDEMNIYDIDGNPIVYYLQEVSAPSPVIANTAVTEVTFRIDEEGNVVPVFEDVVTYNEDGSVADITATLNEGDLNSTETLVEMDGENTYTVFRDNAIKSMDVTKTGVDGDLNGELNVGEDMTYYIEVVNNNNASNTVLVKDDMSGLTEYFDLESDENLDRPVTVTITDGETEEVISDDLTEEELDALDNVIEAGETYTDYTDDGGAYNVVIAEGTTYTITNTEDDSVYNSVTVDEESEEKLRLNSNDVVTVVEGSITFVDQTEEELETLTVRDIMEGVYIDVPANGTATVEFTITANDEFPEYCVTVTNTASVTDGGTCEEDTEEVEPETEPETCIDPETGEEVDPDPETGECETEVEEVDEEDCEEDAKEYTPEFSIPVECPEEPTLEETGGSSYVIYAVIAMIGAGVLFSVFKLVTRKK